MKLTLLRRIVMAAGFGQHHGLIAELLGHSQAAILRHRRRYMLLMLLEHGVGRCGDGHRWRRFRQRGTGHGPQLKGLERNKRR